MEQDTALEVDKKMVKKKEKPKPFLLPQFCKGCGRCIDACPKDCIRLGEQVNQESGFIPVLLNLDDCNGCGLCLSACPEPYGLLPSMDGDESRLGIPEAGMDVLDQELPGAKPVPDTILPLPEMELPVIKGTYASAIGALLGGCRHFFGYPITPSTEGAELLSKLLPMLDGIYVQAVSEVATVNMMYGCGGAGLRCMTFTSSPGFSLMLEGISYMVGSEIPGVIVNVMRGGPGLGNIAPEQSDIKLVCRGLGHGNTHAIVLTPSSPQEMLDLTKLAFDLSFKYRNPVIVLGDGYLGQITGKVTLPKTMVKPGIPEWAVSGDRVHRRNLHTSILLNEPDLEAHNIHLNEKYTEICQSEQRAELFHCDDAEILLVASNTPSRMSKAAVVSLRQKGIRIGLFRPITLWPFPIQDFRPLLDSARQLVVVEASNGQLEAELRLALSHEGVRDIPPIDHVRRFGGILPQQEEIEEKIITLHKELS
jgi:pyruvate/2-oxoacid:ferredoxin oxidoreductase alpha subunit/NAD-dependent dihydropyrimidine dehydrogenase PreA subunit